MYSRTEMNAAIRWPAGAEGVDSPVDNWLQVRDVDLSVDPVTG
jgi:hypothetical protein